MTTPAAAVAAAPVVVPRRQWLPWTVTGAGRGGGGGRRRRTVDEAEASGHGGGALYAHHCRRVHTEAGSPAAAQAVPSPDGRYIAFVAPDKTGIENLWVRPLGSLAAHKLDKTEGANFPFWSPDGQFHRRSSRTEK